VRISKPKYLRSWSINSPHSVEPFRKRPPLVPVVRKMNGVHVIAAYMFKIYFNVILTSHAGLPASTGTADSASSNIGHDLASGLHVRSMVRSNGEVVAVALWE
jgi:hypothetical protein